MPKLTDEELQKLVEQQLKSGAAPGTTPDTDEYLYGLLFNALSTEPSLPSASSHLAENVVSRIEHQKSSKETLNYSLAIAAVIIGSILFTGIALLTISPHTLYRIVNDIYFYKWIIAFIIAAVTVIEVVDNKVVRKQAIY